MIFIDNGDIHDPHINLAFEEYALRNVDTDEDILLFYVNEPSVIIGRNQNTLEEVNQTYLQDHGIPVVRRLSGGGAVYHDLGNLNFSFITNNAKENFHNFRKFTAPVLKVLNEMGVRAELGGRNDIVVAGRKISGNAQYIAAKRMVSHGTLLLNADLDRVVEALKVKTGEITSKGIKSVRSQVVNIAEFLETPPSMEAFRARLLQGIFEGEDEIPQHTMSAAEWEAILALADERYRSWDWNYGRSPAFTVHKIRTFPSGEIEARIEVQNGLVQSVCFVGGFFDRGDVSELEQRLRGVRYNPSSLEQALRNTDISQYFHSVSLEELLHLLY